MDGERNFRRLKADASDRFECGCERSIESTKDKSLAYLAGTDSNSVSDDEVALIERFLGDLLRNMLKA